MPNDKLPSQARIEEEFDKIIMPGYITGIIVVKGPIDEGDRRRAQKLLDLTNTRETLDAAKIFQEPLPDEYWAIAQKMRKYAEAILRGEIYQRI